MYVYQKLISPQISAACPYENSCSEHSKKMIREQGFFKGIILTTDRLMRCNEVSAKDIHHLDIDYDKNKFIDRYETYYEFHEDSIHSR